MKFIDCIEIVGKHSIAFEGEKKYVSTGALDVDHIDDNAVEIVTYDNKPSRADLIVKAGDVIFAKMAGTQKNMVISEENEDYIYSTGFLAIKGKEKIISARCLNYLVTSDFFLRQKDKHSSGATQKAITNKGLENMIINVPDYSKQEKIVSQLDSVTSIIEKRKKEIELLDDFIKARFVELFGTLDNPNQEFAKATLKELCNKITDGKHGGCKAEEGTERYFVGAREIYDDEVHYDTAPEINIDEFEKDYKRCNIEIGDFLIVNTGATIGKSAIATDERTEHTLLQKSVALLKVKKEVLNPVFLKWCYRVNTQMYIVESASAQPNLLLSKINATVIYVPNIELQNQFVSFVEQVDKSKVVDTNIIPEGGFYYGDKFFIS